MSTESISLCKNPKKFYRAHATGNTFLMMDCLEDPSAFTEEIRKNLIDALLAESKDSGLVFEKISPHYRMRVIEKDGTESAFCGNGARAFAHYLYANYAIEEANLLINGSKTIVFGKKPCGTFNVSCEAPSVHSSLSLGRDIFNVCGEPHLIIEDFFCKEQLVKLAKDIQETYSVNVSCIEQQKILTYERGVNAITASCGSACVAATQYLLKQGKTFTAREIPWHCLGGTNWVDTETFSLMGPTWLEI